VACETNIRVEDSDEDSCIRIHIDLAIGTKQLTEGEKARGRKDNCVFFKH
jgi:hypothetical protein